MRKFTVKKTVYETYDATIEADDEDAALVKAENDEDIVWDYFDSDTSYDIEDELTEGGD